MKRSSSRTAQRWLLPVVAAAALMAPVTAGAIAPCSGVQLLRPPAATALEQVPANPVGCIAGRRFPADAGVTLWRCIVDSPDDEPANTSWSHALLIIREGQPIQSYRDTLMGGRFDAWHVLKVDLDADGAEEQVVALWNDQRNGLGINSWTIHVFSNTWQPLGWFDEVLDWGPSSVVAAMPRRSGCDIALTSYEDEGAVAFEARFIRLEDGRLVAATDRPPVRRRLTAAFQHQRTAHFNRDDSLVEGDVAAWLDASAADTPVATDPDRQESERPVSGR